MQKTYSKSLQIFKTIAAYGGGFGIIFLLFSIFASDYNIIFGLGIGLTTASIVFFLLGIFLSLMEEYTESSKGKAPIVTYSKKSYN
ncbi:hypothetical protein [Neobacillus jeddahensis]|uniref:hypothetical protein n=1 Tax=Neobacillus jeddahensis TaxID=1461580 RepID=UPI0005905B8D|nr:hypothetical protein [Neobacillus jeddahensis]